MEGGAELYAVMLLSSSIKTSVVVAVGLMAFLGVVAVVACAAVARAVIIVDRTGAFVVASLFTCFVFFVSPSFW